MYDIISPYLQILNPEQKQAVLHTGNPLLILAGAGSGKTRVITTKIAYLIRECNVPPRAILAVTFTNRAAQEMAERACLIDERAAGAMLRTFHSFGAWFLRRHTQFAPLSERFVIYNEDDQAALLATIMTNASKEEVKGVVHKIARAKDYCMGPDHPDLDAIDRSEEFRRLYRRYEDKLRRIGNADFGDLIKMPVDILRENPDMADGFRSRFEVILIDEYQDTNIAQFELLKAIYDPASYLCVVGDDDQSIYHFRGAEVRNILEFPSQFPETEIIKLERNYRSTAYILKAASSVVAHNKSRLGKNLYAERGEGSLPVLAFLPNQQEEANFCAELVKRSYEEGGCYADWAILYRTNAQSLHFENEFSRRNIPYRLVGSLRFYEREEIKDALSLLSLLVNPRDEVAFRRIINKPSRGIGAVSLKKIVVEAAAQDGNLIAVSRQIREKLSAKAQAGISLFLAALDRSFSTLDKDGASTMVSQLADQAIKHSTYGIEQGIIAGEGLSLCAVSLIMLSGLFTYHKSQDEVSGTQRVANLQELANAMSLYPATLNGLAEFLENAEIDRSRGEQNDDEESPDRVTFITLHNTKGQEFKKVVITGVEQGLFPRESKFGEALEEERRLFYVGATRAKDELYLTSCAERRLYGWTMDVYPSIFLREIDKTALRIIGRAPKGFK
ncbi:MAG: ATP-dependent helicase [Spirochaetaceae bacterium]|jgi:DNA helicase-2/ATP-dependent DNA helicase PcrA|nr:ATP-dependent helicase [Spirochaetaceae bacterium]